MTIQSDGMATASFASGKPVSLYLSIVVLLSAIPEYFLITSGTMSVGGGSAVLAMMWVPGISALIALKILREPFSTIRWRIGRPRFLVYAYCIPLAYVTLAYVPLWTVGFFNAEKEVTLQRILLPLVGAFVNMLATLGEEIGWRGFLFPRLARRTSFSTAALVTGVVWALWRVPGLLLTDYGNDAPWYSALPFFIITLTAISYPMAYLCKAADSIWPAVLFHAAHNAFIQAFFDPFSVKNETSRFLLGETGLALASTSVIAMLLFASIVRRTGAAPAMREYRS